MSEIKDHEFYDENIYGAYPAGSEHRIQISLRASCQGMIELTVSDVVAIAKEFGLAVYRKDSEL